MSVCENQREGKFQIDLMVLIPFLSSLHLQCLYNSVFINFFPVGFSGATSSVEVFSGKGYGD